MATPKQTAAGTWRVQIEVRGARDAATLPTKREAVEWAARRKAEMLAMGNGRASEVKSLADALDRYRREVSPGKRGEIKESLRLQAFPKQERFPARVKLADLMPEHLAEWRDARLKINSRGAVLRDMVLLSHVLEVARREWRWIASNPMRDVRKPAEPDHRERVIAPMEVRRMLRAMGWSARKPVRSVSQAVAWCFVVALQTGMRAGELCGLRWTDVHGDYVLLHAGKTKTGKGRAVPLLASTQRSLQAMKGFDEELVFGLSSQTLDALFRKYRGRCELSGFTFHDARHTAATRLAPLVDVLTLCKIFGWTTATRALVYYNPTGSQLARQLTAASGGAAPTPRSR
jgi:integrase